MESALPHPVRRDRHILLWYPDRYVEERPDEMPAPSARQNTDIYADSRKNIQNRCDIPILIARHDPAGNLIFLFQPTVELPILRGYCGICEICYSVYDVSGRQMTGPGMQQTFAEHTMHVAGFIRLNPEDSEPGARTGRERQ